MPYFRKTIDITISEKLKEILEEIKDSSIIASMLLKRNHKDDLIENHVDYLNISDADQTKISYLSQDKVEKINSIPRSESIEEHGCIYWNNSFRVRARPGSVVQKIFKNLSSRDVEIFNNLYKSALNKINFELKVVDGELIKKYYYESTYSDSRGSLGSSCMKYSNCQNFFNIYIDNKDIVKMLIMLDNDGLLLGRALLWNFDDYKVMDRIYTINDEELAYHFKKWALEKGYMYKHEQKWNNTLAFEINGKKTEHEFCIKLPFYDYSRYPYLDTFKFLDREKGMLYNYIPHDNIQTICAPDGRWYPSDFLALDFITKLYHNRGETIIIKYKDGKFTDEELRTHSNNVEWSRVNDLHILKTDAVYSEEIDDFIFNENLDELNNKESIEKVKQALMARRKYDKRNQ